MYCTNTAEILSKRETAFDAQLRQGLSLARGFLPRASEDIPLRARCLSGFGGILSGEERGGSHRRQQKVEEEEDPKGVGLEGRGGRRRMP